VTGATSVYFGPVRELGDYIVFDNGTELVGQTFSEVSLSLSSGFVAGACYDLYASSVSSTSVSLNAVAWTNTATPPTRGYDRSGRLCQSGAVGNLLLGAIYMDSATGLNNNPASQHISNVYNAVAIPLYALASVNSFTCYTDTAWTTENGSTADGVGRVTYLQCVANSPVSVSYQSVCSGLQYIGIGFNSVTAADASIFCDLEYGALTCTAVIPATVGYVYVQKLLAAYGTVYVNSAGFGSGPSGANFTYLTGIVWN
jgi:hypothetical protein